MTFSTRTNAYSKATSKLLLCLRRYAVVLFLGLSPVVFGATNISGIINQYTTVSAINVPLNKVTVASTAPFSTGDKVLLIQMNGAEITETDNASFGNISNYNDAGNYEFLTVCAVDAGAGEVSFQHLIQRTYDPSDGVVQLITVPQYTDAFVNGILRSDPWNGSTGGVLVFEVSNQLEFGANIAVAARGFDAGLFANSSFSCAWWNVQTGYYYTVASGKGGYKGYGIADHIASKETGRGAQANGGGGGNDHNGGGGGGGNYGVGGQGGERVPQSTFYCKCTAPGKGGKALSSMIDNTDNRVFMGGGGGAGQGNNNSGSSGGDGGAIVIIRADEIIGNNYKINTPGVNAPTASNDGAGGGGAGGSILLDVNTFTGTLTANASGGRGGRVNNSGTSNCNGPGGGGGGGVVWSKNPLPGTVTTDVSGGPSGWILSSGQTGCNVNDVNNATAGAAGAVISGLLIPENSSPFAGCGVLPIELVSFEATAEKDRIRVDWVTATEVNSDHFIIERSMDGKFFDPILTVEAAKNSNTMQYYQAYDNEPEEGTIYYRLLQVDMDGARNYSGTRYAKFIQADRIGNIYPNPVTSFEPMKLELVVKHQKEINFMLVDMVGRTVYEEKRDFQKGKYLHTIPVHHLKPGLYFLKVIFDDNKVSSQKVILAN